MVVLEYSLSVLDDWIIYWCQWFTMDLFSIICILLDLLDLSCMPRQSQHLYVHCRTLTARGAARHRV